MNLRTKIILVAGPTASGKSTFALKIAKKIKGEIINADSMQVYSDLKILTARPKKEDQKKIKHHLYGFQNVAKKLHNTSGVCKSNYLDPELIKYFTVDCEGFLNNFYLNKFGVYSKEDISKKYIEFLENI